MSTQTDHTGIYHDSTAEREERDATLAGTWTIPDYSPTMDELEDAAAALEAELSAPTYDEMMQLTSEWNFR